MVLSLTAAVALAALPGCSHKGAPGNTRVSTAADRSRPQPVLVSRRDIVGFVPLRGTVIAPAFAIADVRASYAQPVQSIAVTVGANVRKGQLIVKLANPMPGESYSVAKQNVKDAETSYAAAKAQYDAAIRTAAEQLAAAKAANGSNAQQSADGSSLPDVYAAEAAYSQAVADRENGLLFYDQTLTSARSAYDDAKAGRKMSMILAPISGTVVTLNARIGQNPPANAPLFTIMDMRAFRVEAPMQPDQAKYVRSGMSVQLTFNEVPNETFTGTVSRIAQRPAAQTGPGPVTGAQPFAEIAFSDDGHVRPLAHATADVKIGQMKNVLSAPASAIVRDRFGNACVDVKRGNNYVRTIVQPGVTDGQFTAILSGIGPNTTVLAPAPGPKMMPASYNGK
jgi:multidrug efflux pump subunit AcrA (membrane-fusion protein)